jgi:hypothetical protein
MTKYVSSKGACRVQNWHSDPECANLKAQATEATASQLEYHNLSPCKRCVDGYEYRHTKQTWKYQNASIDTENDTMMDRL